MSPRAATPHGPDADDDSVEVRHVQPYEARKVYRCPGCDHEIAIGTGHEVVVPRGSRRAPALAYGMLAPRGTACATRTHVTLRLGCCPQLTDLSVSAVEIADALVERGFTAMYLNEHPHIPVHAPRTQYPGDGELPPRYRRFLDPFVTLAFVAARTNLEIGTAVSLVGEHDPITLAKEIATLDLLSGGRLVCGVGFGWHREEFEDHGFPAQVRGKVVLETVAALKALWTQEEASFDGEFVRFGPCWSYPKPVQKPHVPLLLGAPTSPKNLDRVARLFDGFIPMTPPLLSREFEVMLGDLRRRCEETGRDPATVRLMTNERPPLGASWEEVFATAERLGLERVNVLIPPASGPDVLDRDAARRLLDDAAEAFGRS